MTDALPPTARVAEVPARVAPGTLRGRLPPSRMYPAGDSSVSSRFLQLESGLRVRAIETGPRDGPVVILLHGWSGCVYTFRHTLPALSDAGFHAIAVDLKGHGLSDKPQDDAEYTLEAMTHHVGQILDALGLTRAAFVGHSMGAAIALEMANRSPHRVTHLALLASARLGQIIARPLLRGLSIRPLSRLLPYVCFRPNIVLTLWVAHGLRRRFSARDVDEYWAPTQYPETLSVAWSLVRRFDWGAPAEAELRRIQIPCLLMAGTRDRIVSSRDMPAFAAMLPRGRFRKFENEGHLFIESSAQAANAEILTLLTTPA